MAGEVRAEALVVEALVRSAPTEARAEALVVEVLVTVAAAPAAGGGNPIASFISIG